MRLRGLCLLTAVILAGVTACADQKPATQAPVRLLVFGAPEELDAYRQLTKAYGSGKVELIEAADRKDLIAKLSTSVAGGEPPDAFLMNYRFYGQFAARGAIEPLDDRLATSSVIKTADFYPAAMQAFQWAGKQLCLPQNVSSLAVYYNKTLFTKYGVPYPKPGWTWTDLIQTASAMTRDARGARVQATESEGAPAQVAVHGLSVEPSIIRLAPFVWSNGGRLFDDDVNPTRFTLDDPKAREALRNLIDLRLAYGVVPSDEEVEAEDEESRFLNGRLAMLMSSRRPTTTFRASARFDWDVAPLPTYGTAAGILHSDAYCMTKGGRNKDAAWKFLEFANSAKGQEIITATGRTVPSNIAVSKTTAFLDPAKAPQSSQVFLDAIPAIRRVPTLSTWPEIEDVVNGILENAMYRGDKLDTVIREIDEQTRPLFERAQRP